MGGGARQHAIHPPQGSSFPGRRAAQLLNTTGYLLPAATAPPGQLSPESPRSVSKENAHLRLRLDAAMMEVELLRDVVGRLLEMRGPTRVPKRAAPCIATNHQAQQAYQHAVYQEEQHCSMCPGAFNNNNI